MMDHLIMEILYSTPLSDSLLDFTFTTCGEFSLHSKDLTYKKLSSLIVQCVLNKSRSRTCTSIKYLVISVEALIVTSQFSRIRF